MGLLALFDMERKKTDLCDSRDRTASKYLTLFERQQLEKSLAQKIPDRYRQRIEIMLLADEGKTQAEICQTLGCCPGTARHWILIARSGQAPNWQNDKIGRPKIINDRYLQRLRELATQSPKTFGYPFRRWTARWLSRHLAEELEIEVSDRHVNRLLKEMGLSTRSTFEP
jgi:transposase